jgi:hypothetical protein
MVRKHTRRAAKASFAVSLGVALLIGLVASVGAGASPTAKPTVTIGSKNFTEQFILGQLYKQALEATGFTVDSSAPPTRRIEEWRGYTLYSWNMTNWNGIDEKSQPYFASTLNLVKDSPTPNLNVLEVPDNGILVDYVTGQEMIDIYELNAPTGKALTQPTLFQIGFHPPNFSYSYLSRMEIALSHVDAHLASKGLGPAVFARISDLQRVWKKAP